jgi:hypothetical protein
LKQVEDNSEGEENWADYQQSTPPDNEDWAVVQARLK